MTTFALLGALQIGLIYGLVATGTLLSFRMLNFPDLTPDGSFPLGAAVGAVMIIGGGDPVLALCAGTAAGALAGLLTALLSERLGVLNILAGILTMTALYSINIRIMGQPNVALLGQETTIHWLRETFSLSGQMAKTVFSLVVVALMVGLMARIIVSRYGLSLRATGINPRMSAANGIGPSSRIYVGLAIANGLCGLAGAMFAQVYSFADVTMGVGTIIVGLAAVFIGEALIRTANPVFAILACVLGAVVYRLALALALESDAIGLTTSDLNLLTATIVTLAFVIPRISKSAWPFRRAGLAQKSRTQKEAAR
ncbi:ABC transporter permease [Epibacterium sp. Ofav1-8]|uniref:ABC transporter permease n=1 Tax=Epibacterium sp. Ofav1-8 TaxID=2917735 RepID=UPI001EF748F3|nr:ABC transporter permease [Epibacterium sp. Ofav1-8]MCG7626079.1 ABC transporter permease [Epibacterium sp. Ofav1-8]